MASQYNVKVSGVEEYKGKPTIKCAAPWGGSYPLVIYLKEDDAYMADDIKRGDTITIVKGNLKDGKDASKEYNFYWNLAPSGQAPDRAEAIRNMPPVAPKQAPVPDTATAPDTSKFRYSPVPDKLETLKDVVQDAQFRTPAQNMRTDALKQAIEWWKGTGAPEEQVITTASIFERYLATGEVPNAPPAEDKPL